MSKLYPITPTHTHTMHREATEPHATEKHLATLLKLSLMASLISVSAS